MKRRLVAAVGLAALGLSLTAPLASAHDERYVHEFAWGASPNPTTANDGAQVYSNDELVAAKVSMTDGVRSWDVVIRPANGGQPSTCHEDLAQQDGKYPSTVYINCPWDTTRATNHTLPGATSHNDAANVNFGRTWQSQDLGPSANGKYMVEITAYNSGLKCGLFTCDQGPVEPHPLYQSGSDPARWREVWVVNEVAQPAGLNSSFDPATNRIAATWAPNPEPDVSYEVQEKVGDGKWNSVGTIPGNASRYERAVEQPGKYQYQVRAVRPAPTRSSADAVKRSEYATASAVEVAQITPPTTAGANNADGAGGPDPGVFIPEDTTTSTGPAATPGSGPAKGKASAARPGSRPSGASSRPAGSAPAAGEAEGEGPDEGFSSVLPYAEEREGFIDDLGEGEEEEVSMIPGMPVPQPRDTRALLVPMAAGLALFVLAMQGIVFFRRRPAMVGAGDDFDDFDDWMRY